MVRQRVVWKTMGKDRIGLRLHMFESTHGHDDSLG